MKAVTIQPSRRRIHVSEREAEPSLRTSTDVKLRILDVGICGTDKEIAACQYGTPPTGHEHLVIGHECVGEVVEVGRDVTGLQPGDLVVPMVRRPCKHETCLGCRSGRQDFCYTGEFVERGIKEAHGFMTEFVVDDQEYMVRVPRALRDVAVLIEPLTIAQKALAQLADVQRRLPWACPIERGHQRHTCHRAVVLGAGPVGLLGAMALRNAGFETIVYSKTPLPNDRAALVEAIGGRYVSSETTSVEELGRMAGQIDVVYEAVGASQLAFDVMQVLGANGVFIFTGVPARKGPISIDADVLMRRIVLSNQVVLGSVNAGRVDFEAAVSDLTMYLERWPDAVRALITGRYAIDQVEGLLSNRFGGIKNVLAFA